MTGGLPGATPSSPENPPLRLEAERVVLRAKRIEDAPDDHAWRSDPELATFDAVPPLNMSLSEYTRIYKEELRFPPPRQLVLGIEDKATGLHIGNCMCYDIDERRAEGEMGIMIGMREYWNQGYGTEVVRMFLRYLFEQRHLQRIYLHTLDWNVRAQAAFRKAGFNPVREVVRNGRTFIHMEVYSEPRGESENGAEPSR